MKHFCTYFDINYLPRGMCLLESLARHCPAFTLTVLCLDDACYEQLGRNVDPRLKLVRLADLEAADQELLAVRPTRSRLEYYFTCGPAFILHVLTANPGIDLLTYMDADTFFYSDPAPVFSELDGCSVGITVHRFGVVRREGQFNVGWLSFRYDENGLACLRQWREQCIDWCYDRLEDGKYADQKYLDEWPLRFTGVRIIQNRGANAAPWNVRDYRAGWLKGFVTLDQDKLVSFHFHGLKQITPWLWNTNLGLTFRFPSRVLIQHVYLPYIESLRRHSLGASPTGGIKRKRARHPLVQGLRNVVRTGIGILFRQYILVIGDTAV